MPELRDELTTDFSFGMLDGAAATAYPKTALALVLNGRIEADGSVSRRQGSRRTTDAAIATGTGYGAVVFETAAGARQIIVVIGGSVQMSDDNGAAWTEIATGVREDYWSWALMRVGTTNYLFGANGDTTVKRWDGSTWDTLPGAPSGVKFLAVYNSRLYAAGHSGVLIQASKVADPTVWNTNAGGILVQNQTHDGNEIRGLFQIGQTLLVFDKDSTSYVNGFGQLDLVVASGSTGVSRSVGCMAFRTVVAVGDASACWLSERGVEYYTPGSGISLLSRPIQKFMEEVNWSFIRSTPGVPVAEYDPRRQNYYLALPGYNSRNDRAAVLNLRQNITYQRQGALAACGIDRSEAVDGGLLFGGSADGYLTAAAGGSYEAAADDDGYMVLVTDASAGDPAEEDADGYLATATDDTIPAALFMVGGVMHSLGYDGYVRSHAETYDSDDELSDGSGGADVWLTLVSRPFHFQTAAHEKKVRVATVSAIADEESSVTVAVRAGGAVTTAKSLTIPATAFNQAKRKETKVSAKGDAPQLEVRSKDRVRITLMGLAAYPLREGT